MRINNSRCGTVSPFRKSDTDPCSLLQKKIRTLKIQNEEKRQYLGNDKGNAIQKKLNHKYQGSRGGGWERKLTSGSVYSVISKVVSD